MKITDNIEFNPELRLQEQTLEFQAWLLDNCLSKINDRYPVAQWDEYDRPARYDFSADGVHVALMPTYIHNERSNWAISGYEITINA